MTRFALPTPIDHVAVELRFDDCDDPLLLVGAYIAPTSPADPLPVDTVRSFMELCNMHAHCVIGDFNASHTSWARRTTGSASTTRPHAPKMAPVQVLVYRTGLAPQGHL
jgi:hypothetical protein